MQSDPTAFPQHTMKTILSSDWGSALNHMIRKLVPLLAVLITAIDAINSLWHDPRHTALGFWQSMVKLFETPNQPVILLAGASAPIALLAAAPVPTRRRRARSAVAAPPRPPIAPPSEQPRPRPSRRAKKVARGVQ